MPEHTASPINGEKRAPVPIVDFSQFTDGAEAERENAAWAVDDALRTEGFVYLSNHGVPQERVDECFAWSKCFFDLPYEEKMKAPHPPGSAHHRGYSGIGKEQVSQMVFDRDEIAALREAAQDVKESFESGNTTDEMQPNIWPPAETLPGFRPFMESFFEDCATLVHKILTCLAHALALPSPLSLSQTHSTSPFQLRLLHYPPTPAALLRSGARARINAHSDFGSVTLLFQDGVGGLEIETGGVAEGGEKGTGTGTGMAKGKGTFRPVEPRRECVLVNIGDLMERWSNGRWRSTVHRVGLPRSGVYAAANGDGAEAEETTPARYSIPFFAAPNMDAVIDALPGCYGEGNPKKWEPVTTLGYIQMRMAALY